MTLSFLTRLRDRLGGGSETLTPVPGERLRLSGKALRVPLLGSSFEVEMGRQRLQIHPDLTLDPGGRASSPDFLLFDPERYFPGPAHFLRLAPGQKVAISHGVEDQKQLFSFPREAYRRYFQVRHEGDALVFKDPISELGTYLSVLAGEGEGGHLLERRRQALRQVMGIFGGALEPLPSEAALTDLERVNRLLRDAPHRPKDADGNAGGLLELPAGLTPVVVGDLHARVDNLLKILSENGLIGALERREAALILLGDEVHQETEGQIEEMDSSVLMMDLLVKLRLRFPAQVFFLLGNHDSFSTEVMKQGVPQGLLWRKRLQALRGEEYVEQMELLYRQLPLVAVSDSFVACHAGPPRSRVSRETLIDIRRFPGLVHELTWTRARTPGFPAGYGPSDVSRFRKSLGLAEGTAFIVGHHPVSEDSTVWLNARRVANHHVVFSAKSDEIGSMIGIDGEMVPHVYPAEPLLRWVNEQTR
ncbi:MAG: serine/threonine protein phosphatase [bacterium]|nr:serine/threonine protein phosphatase [bacterium]